MKIYIFCLFLCHSLFLFIHPPTYQSIYLSIYVLLIYFYYILHISLYLNLWISISFYSSLSLSLSLTHTYTHTHTHELSRGVMVNMLGCDPVINEFERQSCYFIHFQTNTSQKGYGSNRITHYHHHVAPPARISLTFSRHPSRSSIAPGRSPRLYPVSAQTCCI